MHQFKTTFDDSSCEDLKDSEEAFECTRCEKSFISKLQMKKHIRRDHSGKDNLEKEFTCEKCGLIFRMASLFKMHKIENHTDPTKIKIKCEECDKGFATKSHYLLHKDCRHGNAKVVCYVCGKVYKNNASVQSHIKRSHKTGKVKCVICQKEIAPSHIKQHMKIIHAGKKKKLEMVCRICGKVLTHKSSFTRHLRIHADDRRHPCPICEKKFLKKSYLQSHMLTHTGERPHQCSVCGKSFSIVYNLRTHMKTQHLPKTNT